MFFFYKFTDRYCLICIGDYHSSFTHVLIAFEIGHFTVTAGRKPLTPKKSPIFALLTSATGHNAQYPFHFDTIQKADYALPATYKHFFKLDLDYHCLKTKTKTVL